MAGLVKQLQEQNGFSESECMIAEYLLKNFGKLQVQIEHRYNQETLSIA